MDMHDPAHPGEILAGWLEDLGMSVTAFAAHLGIFWLKPWRAAPAIGSRCRDSLICGKPGRGPGNDRRWRGSPLRFG